MNTAVPSISPGKRAIRETALADLNGLKQRHPGAFARTATRRIFMIGLPLAMVLLAFGAMVWLDFSLVRIWNGLHRLGQFAVLMIPPAPEGRFMAFSIALGETLHQGGFKFGYPLPVVFRDDGAFGLQGA